MLRRTALRLALTTLLLSACASGPGKRTIQIVHTNDLHGHVERAAAVAGVARDARRQNANTLFLDAGDSISGTPVSTVFQGRPIFEIMNAVGVDAMALGNHEFDHGWDHIAGFGEIAQFPLLCANATDPDGKAIGDAPYRIFDLDGVRVGVIGLITNGVPTLTVASASAGCTFEKPLDAAKRVLPEVREKSDIVILLTHVGIDQDAALAGALEGVDLVVGGHTHTKLEQPLRVGSTHVVQAWCYAQQVGIAELTWDGDKGAVTAFSHRIVEIDAETMPNVAEVKELVDAWEAQVDERVREVIGKTDRALSKKMLRSRIERVYRTLLDADFGFQNMGGIRETIDAGEISIRDIWTVLPFDNTLVTIRLKGSQLPKYAQQRLGEKFDPDAEYTLATNSYVSDQQEKYFGTTDAPVEDSGLLMRDEVVNWVRKHHGFDPAPAGSDE